jgi:ABC-type multidrug transport system ATPase subunit
MDPLNRRMMWSYIEDLKQEASIILTTHSMEEAENLADRICIMAFGKLCCIGNSLHLKNKFGGGYRLEIMTGMYISTFLYIFYFYVSSFSFSNTSSFLFRCE